MEPIYTRPLPVNLGFIDWFFSDQPSFGYYLLYHAFSRDCWSSVTQENQDCSWRYFWHSYSVIHIYVLFHMDLFWLTICSGVITSIIRLVYTVKLTQTDDFTWAIMPVGLWA